MNVTAHKPRGKHVKLDGNLGKSKIFGWRMVWLRNLFASWVGARLHFVVIPSCTDWGQEDTHDASRF